MTDAHEKLHQERVAKHEDIVAKLRERAPGETFEDSEGAVYEVIRVNSEFPRPGYVAKHLSGPYANPAFPVRFVGFDSVRERK